MPTEQFLDWDAVRNDVMAYVQMVIALDSDHWRQGEILRYRDSQTGEIKSVKLDREYVDMVEAKLGLTTYELKAFFRRKGIIGHYAYQISFCGPHYDFMDKEDLVNAVIAVRGEVRSCASQ